MSDQNPYSSPAANLERGSEQAEALYQPLAVSPGRGWGWIVEGFEYFKRAPWVWIGMMLIWFIIAVALSFIPLLSLAVSVLSAVFLGGLMLACSVLDEGGVLRVEHLFAGFNTRPGPLAAVGGLYLAGTLGIALVMGLLVVLGGGVGFMSGMSTPESFMTAGFGIGMLIALLVAMLLFVPLLMAFWFAPVLVVRHELPAVEAMRLSFTGCARNLLPLTVYGLAAGGLSILALLTLGLGFLVLSPVLVASVYAAYKDIYLGE